MNLNQMNNLIYNIVTSVILEQPSPREKALTYARRNCILMKYTHKFFKVHYKSASFGRPNNKDSIRQFSPASLLEDIHRV